MEEVHANNKNKFIKNNHFFCISHFNGNIDWISNLNKNNYIIYNKSGENLSKDINHINIENVGYNLYSYLKFIIDNYDKLPNITVFCKDNVFSRHVELDLFQNLLKRNTDFNYFIKSYFLSSLHTSSCRITNYLFRYSTNTYSNYPNT